MARLFRFIVRPSAFLSKEVAEIVRQPRLVLTLVLGPFLILLFFGVGYRNEARALRALFVVEKESVLAAQIERFATSLGPQLILTGVTTDEASAQERLRKGEVDILVFLPSDPLALIRSNKQVTFTLYHAEIDPFQAGYVAFFGQFYVDEINRRVLTYVANQIKEGAAQVQDELEEARTNAKAMREALERGDTAEARRHQRALSRNVNTVEVAARTSLGLLDGVERVVGPGNKSDVDVVRVRLTRVLEDTDTLAEVEEDVSELSVQAEKVSQIEEDLVLLEKELAELQNVDPLVLVSPFRSEAKAVTAVPLKVSDYFAPSVIVLLLQHLAVTFAALSIVRERSVGTMELFRVSPLSALETLVGKYVSYLIFGGLLAAILTGLLVYTLRVPMAGPWGGYALVILALLFASLGIGFVISLISETDSQAVQYTMLVLITSVFFSGFFLRIETLWQPIRVISWALPATYGNQMLRDIMLRGYAPDTALLTGITAIGAALFLFSLILLQRLMARR
ncbi:MAG: ABC transporter permease [Anaerolineae bacterium]|nr:ABC transporter permease [Anaerolineae bacterium]